MPEDATALEHIFESLGEIRSGVNRANELLSGHTEKLANHERMLIDHAARLRVLEAARWKMVGATGLVSGLAAAASAAAAVIALH